MGNTESNIHGIQSDKPLDEQDIGFRIIHVSPDSPAEQAGLEAHLDIIKYNPYLPGQKLFSDFLVLNEGKDVILPVYNIIQQQTRMIKMRLHRNWGTNSIIFGAVIRIECYTDAHLHILAVKDVYLNGPAHQAGLQPFKDFVIGTREIPFKNLDAFAKYVEVNQGQEIKLFIYNSEKEAVREVALTPKQWGGQGLLGCDASFGFFNKIPLRAKDKQAIVEKQGMHNLLSQLNNATSQTTIVKDPHNTENIEDSLHLYPSQKKKDTFDKTQDPYQYQLKKSRQEAPPSQILSSVKDQQQLINQPSYLIDETETEKGAGYNNGVYKTESLNQNDQITKQYQHLRQSSGEMHLSPVIVGNSQDTRSEEYDHKAELYNSEYLKNKRIGLQTPIQTSPHMSLIQDTQITNEKQDNIFSVSNSAPPQIPKNGIPRGNREAKKSSIMQTRRFNFLPTDVVFN